MSDERMSDAEFDVLVSKSFCNPAIWTEAYRARAEESRLAALVEVLEAEKGRLMLQLQTLAEESAHRDCRRWLARGEKTCDIRSCRLALAALTPPTPKKRKSARRK